MVPMLSATLPGKRLSPSLTVVVGDSSWLELHEALFVMATLGELLLGTVGWLFSNSRGLLLLSLGGFIIALLCG